MEDEHVNLVTENGSGQCPFCPSFFIVSCNYGKLTLTINPDPATGNCPHYKGVFFGRDEEGNAILIFSNPDHLKEDQPPNPGKRLDVLGINRDGINLGNAINRLRAMNRAMAALTSTEDGQELLRYILHLEAENLSVFAQPGETQEMIEKAIQRFDTLNHFHGLFDNLWQLIYPGKTDWEYPGQVFNHIRVEFELFRKYIGLNSAIAHAHTFNDEEARKLCPVCISAKESKHYREIFLGDKSKRIENWQNDAINVNQIAWVNWAMRNYPDANTISIVDESQSTTQKIYSVHVDGICVIENGSGDWWPTFKEGVRHITFFLKP